MNTSFHDDNAKEEIRARLDIVEVVGRYVALKPAGANMKGLCPFHKEKTPSFTVNREKGIYYCFGCHESGDVFKFLMEREGLSFPEVLRMTADETGVKLPERSAGAGDKSEGGLSKSQLMTIHEMATRYYYEQMQKSPIAIDYFKGRGLAPETVRDFRLGFSPKGWDNLLNFMAGKGIDAEALVACGLAVKRSESGSIYDRFRERIIFPIFDPAGRPIAFGARAMEKDAQPKYLNSPETLLYKKNRTLYGLNTARSAIKEDQFAIFVEGYMDFLSMYQAGIRNCVASSGTALTTEHGEIIRRFTSRVVLIFDGDSAGIEAARRGVHILLPLGLDVRVLILPDQEDPDSYLKKYGAEAMRKQIAEAGQGFAFVLERSIEARGTESPQAKSAVVKDMALLLENVSDQIVLQEYSQVAGLRLGTNPDLVFGQFRRGKHAGGSIPEQATAARPGDNYDQTIEGALIRLLLHNSDLIEVAMEKVPVESLTDEFTKNLYSLLLDTYREDPGLSSVTDRAKDPEQQRVLARQFLADPWPSETAKDDLDHAVRRIKQKALKTRLREITRLQKAEADPATKLQLLKELKEITLSLKELDIGW